MDFLADVFVCEGDCEVYVIVSLNLSKGLVRDVQIVRTLIKNVPEMMHAMSFPRAAWPRTNGISLPLSLFLRFQ